MSYRVAPQAEDDLDEIWLYIAKESSSVEVASRFIDSLTQRFLLLAQHPYLGRSRDAELGIGTRTFPLGHYVILYRVANRNVFILRVVHGKRHLDALFP